MTLLRLTQARDRTGQGQGSAFQTAILGHFQQLRELGQGLDLHLHVGGRVVSIHKVLMVSRSVWLTECLAGGASADLIIPNVATEDSVSTLVSLLYGGSPTVGFGVYAGLQALCHCLGLNSWLYEVVNSTVQEEEIAVMDLAQQLDPSDEGDTNKHQQKSPTMVASVGGALKTRVKRPTQPKDDLESRSKCSVVKGGRQTVENTDLKQTVIQEKPKRRLRSSNERTRRSTPRSDIKTPPIGKRISSRSCSRQKFTCELCSTTSISSEMLLAHYNRIHFNNYTRGDGRGGSLSTPRNKTETDLNINRRACAKTDRGKRVDGIKSLGENFNDAQGRAKTSAQGRANSSAHERAKPSKTRSSLRTGRVHSGVVKDNSLSEVARGGRSRKGNRVQGGNGKSGTGQQIKHPTTSSASSVYRKVVVPAVQHKITSSTSSTLVSTGDKKDMYLSMWNEALSDKVPKQGPISARLQQELSPTFSKFISAKANMILSRGLQMEARHHAASLLQDRLISFEVAKKAVATLQDLSK